MAQTSEGSVLECDSRKYQEAACIRKSLIGKCYQIITKTEITHNKCKYKHVCTAYDIT